MSGSTSIEITASGALLSVRYHGRVTAKALEAHRGELRASSAELQPGFTLLTDLSDLESMEPSCVPLLSGIMEDIGAMGVGRIVRVIPNPARDIGFNILSSFHYERSIPISTCETLAEAEQMLG